MLNNLLSEHDLAKLSHDQKQFLVQRIDHALDTDDKIRAIIASKLQNSLKLVDPNLKTITGP